MALSQFLRRRSSLFIRKNAFQRPVMWFSSVSSDTKSEKPSKLKRICMSKEQRAKAVESFVKMYMESNPGGFPNATHIRNQVGGSWYTVKEALHLIKEKMIGVPQPENDHNLIASVPALVSTASNAGAHRDLAVIPLGTDGNVRQIAINAPAGSSSDLLVDATASDITKIHDSSGSCELPTECVLLSAKSERKASGTEKDASADVIPLVSRSQTEGTILNAVSDSSQLELENGHMLWNSEHSNTCKSSGRVLVSNSAKLSDIEHSKVNCTGYRDQQENKESTCSLLLNSCSDMTDKSALHRSSGEASGLADLFRNNMDDEAIAKCKIGHLLTEGSQSGTFWPERERNSKDNQLSTRDLFSSSESPSNMQVIGLNKSVFTKYKNHPPEEEMSIFSETQSVVSKVTEPFATAKQTGSLQDTNTINNQASKVMNNIKSDVFMQRYIGHLEEHKENDGAKSFQIKHLIGCITKLPPPSTTTSKENTPTWKNDGSSNRSLRGGPESLTSLKSFGKKGKKVPEGTTVSAKLEDHGHVHVLSANVNTENDAASHPEFAIPALVKSLLPNKKKWNDMKDKVFLSKESDHNKAVVKFLRTMRESDIYTAFQDCGKISKVELTNVEGAFYQVAYVYFTTRQGLRKALEKTDLVIHNSMATVGAADLIEDISNRISIPNLIGDPNVPGALIKNPTRTVMIRKLTDDIHSRHIEAALTLCGINVTGFFLGSSNSVAYVEFETEDSKEIALAKRSIDVLGKRLLISRIDVPRTTVVRISYHQSIKRDNLVQVCKSVGKVRLVRDRRRGLIDVNYVVAEWPNMLNIINRLNAIQVDGRPLLAQPATIIPPEILRVLWHHPEERKHVKTILQKLLHKVGENLRADLDLMESFYTDRL